MARHVEIEDTQQTFQVGRRITSLEHEARSAGRAIRDVLEATEPGHRFGARQVLLAARELGVDVIEDGRTLANGAEALGEGTAFVATELEQTEYETTGVLVANNSLFRDVNRPLTAEHGSIHGTGSSPHGHVGAGHGPLVTLPAPAVVDPPGPLPVAEPAPVDQPAAEPGAVGPQPWASGGDGVLDEVEGVPTVESVVDALDQRT